MKAVKSTFISIKSFLEKASITNAEFTALILVIVFIIWDLFIRDIAPDIADLFNSDLLPIVMMNIGLAFITILIPMAIFFFSSPGQNMLFEWDKTVILDKVLRAKGLLWAMGSFFLPLLIWDLEFFNWNYSSLTIRITSFCLFLVGFIFLVKTLIRAYLWIRVIETPNEPSGDDFRNKLRYEYLDSPNNWNEKEKIWSLTWPRKDINIIDERNLLKKFLDNLDHLIRNDILDKFARYLTIFKTYFDKRNFRNWTTFSDFFSSILKWHKIISRKEKIKEETRKMEYIWEAESSLGEFIKKSVIGSFKNGTGYLLFKIMEEHIRHEDRQYSERLSYLIFLPFFENVAESPEKYEFWKSYFPREWKITTEWCLKWLKNKNEFMPSILFDIFIDWFQNRIVEAGDKYDEKLELVARELFPDTNPHLWAQILILIFRPFDKTRIQSLIENPLNFGLIGRTFVYWNQDDWKQIRKEKMIKEENNTIGMALRLFKGYFTKDVLTQHIKEIEILEENYDKDSNEEISRKGLLMIFRKMLKAIE